MNPKINDINNIRHAREIYNNSDYAVYSTYCSHVLNDPNFYKRMIYDYATPPSNAEILKAKEWHKVWWEKEGKFFTGKKAKKDKNDPAQTDTKTV